MTKFSLLLSIWMISCIAFAISPTTLSVNSTAGSLATAITNAGGTLSTVKELTVSGTINLTDFTTIKNSLSALQILDLSGTTISKDSIKKYIISGEYYEIIPANEIPDNALYNKTSLTSISLPSNITSTGYRAFSGCTNLTEVTMPSTINTIDSSSFQNCSSLTSLPITSSITTIQSSAFAGCNGTSVITVPASVLSIETGAFTGEHSINVESSNPNYSSLDGVLFNKNQTTLIEFTNTNSNSYTIPSSVVTIDKYAFFNDTSLISISIPNSVKTICENAFLNCTGLTSISIPSSIDSIGDYAFAHCSNLTTINMYQSSPFDITSNFMFSTLPNCVVHVPIGSKTTYESTLGWSYMFKEIVEDLPTSTTIAKQSDIKITTANGKVIISALETGEIITVYNLNGIVINKQIATDETISINIPAHGMYVVKVNNESIKLLY